MVSRFLSGDRTDVWINGEYKSDRRTKGSDKRGGFGAVSEKGFPPPANLTADISTPKIANARVNLIYSHALDVLPSLYIFVLSTWAPENPAGVRLRTTPRQGYCMSTNYLERTWQRLTNRLVASSGSFLSILLIEALSLRRYDALLR